MALKNNHAMKRTYLSIIAISIAAIATTFAAGKSSSKASPSPSASASASGAETKSPRPLPFHGMVSAVDQTAKTFTIAGKEKSRVFKVSDKTEISKGGASATMSDIAENSEVSGSYWKNADGSLEAKTVKVGPAKAAASPSAAPKKP
jgi:hypothetical protein